MIEVNSLWETVKTLSRKDHAGYTSTSEFNQILSLAQEDLYRYYLAMYAETTQVSEALSPFVAEVNLTKVNGIYTLPSDYRQRIMFGLMIYDKSTESFSVAPANYKSQNEIWMTNVNAIEAPSFNNPYNYSVEVFGSTLKAYPSDFMGQVIMKYFINAPVAERGFTLNVVTQEEEYDSGATTDLIWPVSETPNFVDILLLYKGLSIRNSEIIEWVANKRGLINQKQNL